MNIDEKQSLLRKLHLLSIFSVNSSMEKICHNVQKQPWSSAGWQKGWRKLEEGESEGLVWEACPGFRWTDWTSGCWVTTGATGDTDSCLSQPNPLVTQSEKHLPFYGSTSVHLHGCFFLNHSSSDLEGLAIGIFYALSLSFPFFLFIVHLKNYEPCLRKSIP